MLETGHRPPFLMPLKVGAEYPVGQPLLGTFIGYRERLLLA